MDTSQIESYQIAYSPAEVAAFDINIPHTVIEWRRYFYATSPERLNVHRLLNYDPINCNNLDIKASSIYIGRKARKGLLTSVNDKVVEYYKEMRDGDWDKNMFKNKSPRARKKSEGFGKPKSNSKKK